MDKAPRLSARRAKEQYAEGSQASSGQHAPQSLTPSFAADANLLAPVVKLLHP